MAYHLTVPSYPGLSAREIVDVFRDAISSEVGCDLDDDHADVPFSDLGLDALDAITVLGIVTDRTGIEFPASLFRDCTSFSQITKTLAGNHVKGSQKLGFPRLPLDELAVMNI